MTESASSAAPPTATGRLSWALGFLAWIPIPFVSLIVAAFAMVAVQSAARRTGHPTAIANARHAANWGLTVVAVIAALALYVAIVAIGFPELRQGFFPIGFAVIGFIVLSLAHTVVTIAGTVISGRGVVVNPRIAIPFFRAQTAV